MGIFWELEKFYDIVRLTDLISAATLAEFPMMKLVVSVNMYLSPSILTVNGCCSGPVQPYRSLTAGCRFANAMAHVLLYHILKGLHAGCYPVEAPRQFAHDLAQFAAGTPTSVVDKIDSSVIELVEDVHSRDLSIRSKSKLLGSGPL